MAHIIYIDNSVAEYKPIEEPEIAHDLVKVAHQQTKLGMVIFGLLLTFLLVFFS